MIAMIDEIQLDFFSKIWSFVCASDSLQLAAGCTVVRRFAAFISYFALYSAFYLFGRWLTLALQSEWKAERGLCAAPQSTWLQRLFSAKYEYLFPLREKKSSQNVLKSKVRLYYAVRSKA